MRRQTCVGGFQNGGIRGEKENQRGQMAIIAQINSCLFEEMIKVWDDVQFLHVVISNVQAIR